MSLTDHLRGKLEKAPPIIIVLLSSISAFSIYVCTYGFRKGFAANTYSGQSFWGVDYKIWLVIAQIFGYALSKFIGVRFIAEVKRHQRLPRILALILVAWISLLGLALLPAPWGILCLFINGIPLGLIWGLIYSYLEGRRNTELMGAILCTSFIFAAGLIKSIGQFFLTVLHVAENWMPFAVGALFFIPLLFFTFLLDLTPPPDEKDQQSRMIRLPMYAAQRKAFLMRFWPGIIFNVCLYVALTVMRDMRDYFEIEIWRSLVPGKLPAFLYTQIDAPVSICILVLMSLMIYVKNNLRAFQLAHLSIMMGFLVIGGTALLYYFHSISAYQLMYAVAFGLYLSYVPYSLFFFDRLIALFRVKGNVGFLIYFADSIGYSGSVLIMLYKQFGPEKLSWGNFFIHSLTIVSIIGILCIILSYRYFKNLYSVQKDTPATSSPQIEMRNTIIIEGI